MSVPLQRPGVTRVSTASFEAEQHALLRSMNAILEARRLIIGVAVGAAVVTAVVTLVLPRNYTSSVLLQPQTRKPGGSLGGLAAQLGVNLPAGEGMQPPAFYADLARSPTILGLVVDQPVGTEGGKPVMLADYYDVSDDTPALRRYRAIEKLMDDVHVTLNPRTGVVTIDVTLKDPKLAKRTIERLVEELDAYNLNSRQSQARAERRFSESRVQEAKRELREAEDRMRTFLKQNRGPRVTPDLKFEEDGLQREILMRQQVYNTLTQLYEQARLDEVRDTPVLNVVEPAIEAPKPDKRGLVLKAVVALAAGFVLSLVFVLVRAGLSVELEGDPVAQFRDLKEATLVDVRRLRRLVPLGHR